MKSAKGAPCVPKYIFGEPGTSSKPARVSQERLLFVPPPTASAAAMTTATSWPPALARIRLSLAVPGRYQSTCTANIIIILTTCTRSATKCVACNVAPYKAFTCTLNRLREPCKRVTCGAPCYKSRACGPPQISETTKLFACSITSTSRWLGGKAIFVSPTSRVLVMVEGTSARLVSNVIMVQGTSCWLGAY